MLYIVTAERIPADERLRERIFIEAANAGEAWARASDECKRLAVMSVIVDVRMRPSCTGAKASGKSSFASSERIGQRTGLNVLQSAVGALFLAILAMTGCLALAPAHAQHGLGTVSTSAGKSAKIENTMEFHRADTLRRLMSRAA